MSRMKFCQFSFSLILFAVSFGEASSKSTYLEQSDFAVEVGRQILALTDRKLVFEVTTQNHLMCLSLFYKGSFHYKLLGNETVKVFVHRDANQRSLLHYDLLDLPLNLKFNSEDPQQLFAQFARMLGTIFQGVEFAAFPSIRGRGFAYIGNLLAANTLEPKQNVMFLRPPHGGYRDNNSAYAAFRSLLSVLFDDQAPLGWGRFGRPSESSFKDLAGNISVKYTKDSSFWLKKAQIFQVSTAQSVLYKMEKIRESPDFQDHLNEAMVIAMQRGIIDNSDIEKPLGREDTVFIIDLKAYHANLTVLLDGHLKKYLDEAVEASIKSPRRTVVFYESEQNHVCLQNGNLIRR